MRTQTPEWAALTILDHQIVACAQQAEQVSPAAALLIREQIGPLVPQEHKVEAPTSQAYEVGR